jgi:hypothetical protein
MRSRNFRLLHAVNKAGHSADLSIKLTQLGWDIDRQSALDRVRTVLMKASECVATVAIDSEQ